MMWEITAAQDESAWFDDYVGSIVSSRSQRIIPAHLGSIGTVDWFWYSPTPSSYFLQLHGGTLDDRHTVRRYIESSLDDYGLRRISVSWSPADRAQVYAKALRLIRTNKVQVHDNMPSYIAGTVEGDHGVYHPEIQRDPNVSPRSQNGIISGSCGCEWGSFMNTPRTRNFKRFQNAPCSHLIALWWLAQSMPVDNGDENPLLQNGQGDITQFTPLHQNPLMNFAPNMPGVNIPGLTPRQELDTNQRSFGPDEAEGVSYRMDNPELALPQSPPPDVDPDGSVPGKKVTTPGNPIQYPGGTYSKAFI